MGSMGGSEDSFWKSLELRLSGLAASPCRAISPAHTSLFIGSVIWVISVGTEIKKLINK